MAWWWPFAASGTVPQIGASADPAFAPAQPSSVQGLEAGATGRRMSSFRPGAAHVNTLVSRAGRTVQDRARWFLRNNAYGIAATDWWANRVVGTGITPSWLSVSKSQKKALRQLWDDWTDEADAEGLTDLYGLARRGAREVFAAGEVFFRKRYRRPEDGLSVPFQLQMLPSEMLDPNYNAVLGGNVVRQGIEFDAIGRRVAYHFWRIHPADSTEQQVGAGQRVRVPASEVLHLMDPVEAGQIRGLSRFSNVTLKMFNLDVYDDAEIERKKNAALHAGFVKPGSATGEVDELLQPSDIPADAGKLAQPVEDEEPPEPLEPGAMYRLKPGEEIAFSEPADVGGNYEAFQYRTLLAIAVGLGVPYFALTGDTAKANYSSLRAALIDAKARIEPWQWSVLIFAFFRPVLAEWVTQAVLAGAVRGLTPEAFMRDRRKFLRVRWMPPAFAWVDPLKEVQAEALAVEKHFKARSDVIEASGFDAEETDQRIAADQARERALGIVPIGHNGGPPLNSDEPPDDGPAPPPPEE